MTTALVIGASRGLGLEFVRQLRSKGNRVIATIRKPADTGPLEELGARVIVHDVCDSESWGRLAAQLTEEPIDLLLQVAGIFGPEDGCARVPDPEAFDAVMHTNLLGTMQALAVFGPLIRENAAKFVVISSDLGSIDAAESDHAWIYRASKAGVNMSVKAASAELAPGICVAMSPGWVRTDMGGPEAPLSCEESIRGMLQVIEGLSATDNGTYRDHAGRHVSW